MPAVSWTNPHNIAPDPEKEYIAMITYLPIAGYLKMPGFFMDVSAMQTQLNSAKGLIGYMMRADVISKNSYTFSVWEDRKSLYDFVRSGTHNKTMSENPDYLGEDRKFIEIYIKGSQVPLSWDKVIRIVNQN